MGHALERVTSRVYRVGRGARWLAALITFAAWGSGAVLGAQASPPAAPSTTAPAPGLRKGDAGAPSEKLRDGEIVGPKAFTQEVPSAAYKIEMLPIPADESRGIKAFWMSKTELAWEAFDVYAYRLDEPEEKREGIDATTRPTKPYLPPDRGFGHEGFAAISMSHRNAERFCAWLSEKSGRVYRLAREDEWEHAARAGGTGAYVSGEDAKSLGEFAWTNANSDGAPHKAGAKKPNAWGLLDMAGNVREWVNGRDGVPVAKGGSYVDAPEDCAIAKRWLQERAWNASDPQMPKSKWWLSDGPFIGFRIVCEAPAKADANDPSKPAAPTVGAPGAQAPANDTSR